MGKKLSEKHKEKLIELYSTGKYNYSELGRIIGFSSTAIGKYLNQEGFKAKSKNILSRKYTLNENFFEIIDNEEKAYFLGILYADGYNNTDRKSINLSLKEEDVSILLKLKDSIFSSRPLQFINSQPLRDKGVNASNQYRLALSSKKLSEDLEKLGCIQKKSLILTFPTEQQVPPHLIHHFIRGYFEGDGWIGRKSLCIAGTQSFCGSITDLLKQLLQINTYTRTRFPERNNSVRMLEISGRNQCRKFFDFIYNNSSIYLQRKFDKWIEFYN